MKIRNNKKEQKKVRNVRNFLWIIITPSHASYTQPHWNEFLQMKKKFKKSWRKKENGNLFMMCFSLNLDIESERWDCCIEKFQYKLLVGFVIIAPMG